MNISDCKGRKSLGEVAYSNGLASDEPDVGVAMMFELAAQL